MDRQTTPRPPFSAQQARSGVWSAVTTIPCIPTTIVASAKHRRGSLEYLLLVPMAPSPIFPADRANLKAFSPVR